jgi:hypothetical protein
LAILNYYKRPYISNAPFILKKKEDPSTPQRNMEHHLAFYGQRTLDGKVVLQAAATGFEGHMFETSDVTGSKFQGSIRNFGLHVNVSPSSLDCP